MVDYASVRLKKSLIQHIDKRIDGKKIVSREQAVEALIEKALGHDKPHTAVFLLGGTGTRFRPITYELPKALLPVKGRTVPKHLFDLFKKFGITDYVFAVGHMADKIKDYFGDGSRWGVKITYSVEQEPLGSAGAIKLAGKFLNNGPFIVTNGDELKDIDIEEMFRFHRRSKASISVALTEVGDPSAYGVAKLDGDRIIKFVEKPTLEDAPSKLINSGLSIWEPEMLDMIPEGFTMYEKDIFPKIAANNKLYGYKFEGQWFDTGTPERYEKALREWKGIR